MPGAEGEGDQAFLRDLYVPVLRASYDRDHGVVRPDRSQATAVCTAQEGLRVLQSSPGDQPERLPVRQLSPGPKDAW